MTFMEWALEQAIKHPQLENTLVTANGDWLDVLLSDGRTFRFRPGALIKPDAPLDQRTELLNRLISIGVDQAQEAQVSESDRSSLASSTSTAGNASATNNAGSTNSSDGTDSADSITPPTQATIVPIVRSADYFLPATPDADSIIYLPLTDFIAVGLAYDMPETIQPIYYEQFEDVHDIGAMMTDAVTTLRLLTDGTQQMVEIGITEIAGAQVMTFLQPANYELSWFADLDMIQQVAERMRHERPDDIPLFVPASRTKLYIVFSGDPHLADFFQLLLAQRDSPDAVYPLPHTVAADGWLEWQPFPDSELAQVLGALRNHFREKIYATQEQLLSSWPTFGAVKPFVARRLKSGERVSNATWDASDKHGSVPVTDFLTFTRSASPHPWESVTPVHITVRSHIAREIWPEGITPVDNLWPPRYGVVGFPDDETLLQLRDATDRQF
ncbi:hypothetical protein V3M69_07895 [Trueperella pyogenes]|uniref:hypothetical protein n=1 Tax=Trueperella pyogenes TaxID=1661 RepID=UPI000E0D79C0|nr:hypothetical protein [Trueperella pyogenes]WHU60437.1 hypothetical protein QEV13_07195 [Trueperella pyogenes]